MITSNLPNKRLKVTLLMHDSIIDAVTDELDQHLKLHKFKSFVNDRHILKGFNLTNNLMQELFAYMDPHKKGYLTMHDWDRIFKETRDHEPSLDDILKLIASIYDNKQQAIQMMKTITQEQDKITKDEFVQFINQIVPQRYTNDQLKQVWK